MRDFWRAIKFASIDKKLTFLAVFVSFAYTIVDVIIPVVLKNIFDLMETSIREGFDGTVDQRFWLFIGFFGFLIIFQSIIGQTNNFFITKWFTETRKILTLKVFSHLEYLQLNYFEKNSTGKIKERVDKGIQDLNNIMEGALMDIAPQVLYILISMTVLFSVSYIFGFILLFGLPLFVFISIKYSPRLVAIQDKVRDADEQSSTVATETIMNIKTVKSFSAEERHYKNLFKYINKSTINKMKYIVTRIKMNIFRFLIVNIAQIIILALGTYWVLTAKISLGTMTLAWTYTNRSFGPLWYLTRVVDGIQKDLRSVRRVFELLDTEPEIVDIADAKQLRITKGKVEFKNVFFGYQDKQIIKGINLDLEPGKILAIVGKSGVGKSTLIKLLMRFYEPQKGSILIDGQDITKVSQKSLREKVGVVMQDSSLFNDTAFNNIAYGKKTSKKMNIYNAAKVANADNFIKKLPQGYETIVGERGVKLSGGEQQRINIARAILKNPPILVLDEATSSLDSESEQLIQDALWKLIEGRTTIIIAHRLSTVMKADLIVVMDKGKIVEQGTHKDLIEHKGIYSKLFEIQSGGYLK